MGEIMPELERETARLGERLDALRRVRSAQEAARAEATDALAGLQALRAEVARAVRRRDAVEAPRRIAALALEAEERARDLDDLAEVLRGAEAPASADAEPFETRRGALMRPVAGQITGGVGSVDPWGRTGSGVTFTAPAYAQVIAPTDATVRFVDRLIDYGRVVVLEPEPGWLLVLAGLAETTHAPGEPVLAGEPLGTLGGALPTSEEFLLEAGAEAGQITQEQLYVELRRQGEPIDPAPWFANATE
jgi:septal ring factor EnvC (AmiA/AmiB activator)